MSATLPDGPGAVAAILPVSEPALQRLAAYADLLRSWQVAKNLVAPSTLADLWRRHMADGAQALAAAPDARRWLDLGSGAGFPGLVTAALLADDGAAHVTLVESNGRKAAFLRTVIRELRLPATVLAERIEDAGSRFLATIGSVDAVSARALASLADLLDLAAPWLTTGSRGVFHKGRDFASERAAATPNWSFDLTEIVSKVDPEGRVVVLENVRPRENREPR